MADPEQANCTCCGLPGKCFNLINWTYHMEHVHLESPFWSCANPECIKQVAAFKELSGYSTAPYGDSPDEPTQVHQIFETRRRSQHG